MAKLKLQIQLPWIPYVFFIISLSLTLLVTYFISNQTNTADRLRFNNAVLDTNTSTETRLQTYIALLRGTAGLFAADPSLTQQQFTAYVKRLNLQKNYSGAQGIGFIQKVENADKDNYIQTVQSQDDPQFTINPPGDRAEYYVVRYLTRRDLLSPISLGLDMYDDPMRRSTIEKARDLGVSFATEKLVITDRITDKKIIGFIIFTPVYANGTIPSTIAQRRADIIGFVYIPFQVDRLLNGIINEKTLPQLLNYQIYDGANLNNKNLIYDTRSIHPQQSNYLPRLKDIRQINIAGRTWTVIYTNHPQFDLESDKNIPTLVFIGGLLVSCIFFMLSRSQYLARTNAEIAANNLHASQRELQKAINHRDNFISIASHELKTPLTSLKVYAEVLLRQFNLTGDEKTTDYLIKINRQIDKLNLLIQDLLDVSRIQTNQMTFREEKFDLNDLAKEVIDNAEQIADHHNITLIGSIRKKIWGDRERISQVLLNLLTNAIKYSPQANKINVTLKETNQNAVISVKDFGIGISKEHQKKIFDRFYRISDTKGRTFPGLGIGLFISQAIVRRHGGEILLTSQPGHGSTFSFTLPFNKKRVKS